MPQRLVPFLLMSLGAGFLLALALQADVRVVTALTVAITVLLWATQTVPEYFTALAFIATTLALGTIRPEAALAGFQSKAIWLVFAGIVFGAAMNAHDVGGRLFDRLLAHIRSYRLLVWSVGGFSLAAAFFIPSAMGRAVLLAPLLRALADRLGLAADAPARIGLYLAALTATSIPPFTVLPSNVANIVMLGAMETAYGHGISYADYFLLNFPVLGLGMFLICQLLILHLFPGDLAPREAGAGAHENAAAATPEQKRLAVIMAVTLLLWATDRWHGHAAAWVGLAAAVLLLTPRIGVLPPATLTKLNFGPWFFVAGAIALGSVIRDSGLGESMLVWLFARFDASGWSAFWQYAGLVLGTQLLAVFTTLPALPSVYTPLAGEVAAHLDWPLDAAILAQVPAFVIFALPYQAPPILVGITLLDIPLAAAARLLARGFVVGLLVLVPLHYLWGRLIGVFP